MNIIQQILSENLTYCSEQALLDLTSVVMSNKKNQIKGIIVEAGCGLGGSAIAIASSKEKDRNFYIYDVFDMIPPPSTKDGADVHERYGAILSGESSGIGGGRYYGYEEHLKQKVQDNFSRLGYPVDENNINLIKGLYQDSLSIDKPVSMAHIDCDWFDSVYICLERICPHLVSKGTLIVDDYYAWSGCKKAVDEYFKSKPNYTFVYKSRLHIIKN